MPTGSDLRQKYLDFFKQRGHVVIPPAPLVPESDPSTLFTSSGMQPLIPFLLGEPHPQGRRLVNIQPSFRAQDLEEVGDNRHTTFFEMLGNWSLGDYFKAEQLAWFWEFLTSVLKLSPDRLYVTVFAGNDAVPKDTLSAGILQKIGLKKDHLFYYGVENNWWSRSGPPDQMPESEPGGPDSEVFYDFGADLGIHEKSGFKDQKCHPNCDCGRFLEIGNSVFMQYQKNADGTLGELPQKNVDFGGGLERTLAAVQNTPDIFRTDLFYPIIDLAEKAADKSYADPAFQPQFRVIADHLKASVMLASDGVFPSNKAQGYILRRLIRRSVVKMRKLISGPVTDFCGRMVVAAGNIYREVYLSDSQIRQAAEIISAEVDKFDHVLTRGLKEITRYPKLDGKIAFNLLQTYGFPWELTYEIATDLGQHINPADFQTEFARHQTLSRTASRGMFKGGLRDQSEITTKYHTATHLLHQALRSTLGDHVSQKGSNITSDRLRFDFSHDQKLNPQEIQAVENLVNQKISENLPVTRQEMAKDEALKTGALAFFAQKYPDVVSVYTIGSQNNWYSREICGGPHVSSTGEIGKIKIVKEESAGSGVRRIYAQIIK